MRKTFVKELTMLAQDERVILIVGDVGFSYIEDFAKQFPKQYINSGVCEQTMMGMAAGLAFAGFRPYVYSMIPFVIMRCFEQLRNDVCYSDANVKVIGVRGSVHYKFLGASHNIVSNEDDTILSCMPNLTRHYPENPDEVREVMRATYVDEHPAYIRL